VTSWNTPNRAGGALGHHPALHPVGAVQAQFDRERPLARDGPAPVRRQPLAIFFGIEIDRIAEGRGEGIGRNAVDFIDLVGPDDLLVDHVHAPVADAGQALDHGQHMLVLQAQAVCAGAFQFADHQPGQIPQALQQRLVRTRTRFGVDDAQGAQIGAVRSRQQGARIEADVHLAGDIGIVDEARI
jgi:hypothetical protein